MKRYFGLIIAGLINLLTPCAAPASAGTAPDIMRRGLPNLRVNDIAQDSLGYIWIATPNGLCRNMGSSIEVFQPERGNPESLPSTNIVAVLYRHPDIWVATSRGIASRDISRNGFTRYGGGKGQANSFFNGFLTLGDRLLVYGSAGLFEVDKPARKLRHILSLPSGQIIAGTTDSTGNVWLVAGNTLARLDGTLTQTDRLTLPANLGVNCIRHWRGLLLLGTANGLKQLDPATRKISNAAPGTILDQCEIRSMLQTDDDAFIVATSRHGELICNLATRECATSSRDFNFSALPSSDVMVGFIDRDSNVWLGTLDQGLLLAYNKYSIFNIDRALSGAFRNKFVTAVRADRKGRVWVGTRYEGLFLYDPATHEAAKIKLPEPNALVDQIFIDNQDRVWVGTNHGLYVGPDSATDAWRSARRLPSSMVTAALDSAGNIWTGSPDNGIFIYNPDLTLRKHLLGNGIRNKNIPKIIPLRSGQMLAAAYTDGLYLIDPESYAVEPLDSRYSDQWTSAIDMLQGRDGRIWVGTFDNYLLSYDPEKKLLRQYSDFPAQDVVAISEDGSGYLWVSTSNGLYNIDPSTGQRRSFYNGFSATSEQFHEKAATRSPDGSIYFGGNYGIQQVTPANERKATKGIPVYLTGLKPLYGSLGSSDSIADPAFVRTLSLAHSNNGIRISFVGLSYGAEVRYAHMLKGYDRDWIETGEYSNAVYSNLPAGNYEFLVRTRTSGEWSEPTHLLDLEVKCAPWLHPLAIALYVITLIALVILSLKLHIRFKLEKERMAVAERKVEAERNIATAKINFFNNISHELRTPLTLILAPVKLLLGNFTKMAPADIRKNLEYVNTNVQRMIHLTTQILNFREMEGETPPLAVSENDIVSQLESITGLFNIYAAERGITIELICHIREKSLWYDADSVEKMLNNLIFNSIKYTSDNGHITVRAELTRRPEYIGTPAGLYLELSVVDDGIGIDRAQSKLLFTRFKRLLSPASRRKTNGFGIGLNFVQKLVDKHHGAIAGRPNGLKGMTFVVDIPVDRDAYSDEELAQQTPEVETPSPAHMEDVEPARRDTLPDEPADTPEPDGQMLPKVLIVEDQKDLAEFISTIFAGEFEVITASNGLEGAEKARMAQPDLVVSDIMMPIMDGIEMLGKIKNDPETSHIPVIVLTAKNRETDQIEGFRTGADMYLCKPFSPEVLLSAARSVLANIERLRHELAATAGSDDKSVVENDGVSDFDRRFLTRLYNFIDDNLSNPDLNINLLCRELCMSRTSFYRKIKSLTNLTPYDMLRIFRLNRSAELLKMRKYTLGEIADFTGFSTHSHFSTLFRKHFGMTPSEYQQANAPAPSQGNPKESPLKE